MCDALRALSRTTTSNRVVESARVPSRSEDFFTRSSLSPFRSLFLCHASHRIDCLTLSHRAPVARAARNASHRNQRAHTGLHILSLFSKLLPRRVKRLTLSLSL